MEGPVKILRDRIESLSFLDNNFEDWLSHTKVLLSRIFGEDSKNLALLERILESDDLRYCLDTIDSDPYRYEQYCRVKDKVIDVLKVCIQELEIIEVMGSDKEAASNAADQFRTSLLEKVPQCDPVVVEFSD